MKLWGGRFTKNTNELVEIFTASISFDHVLAHVDIIGSIAHAKALEKCNILNNEELEKIISGLKIIDEKIKTD